MINKIKALKTLLINQNPEAVICNHYAFTKTKPSIEFGNQEHFVRTFRGHNMQRYTSDEMKNIHGIMRGDWSKGEADEHNVFQLIMNYASSILNNVNGEPVVDYLRAFDWREGSLGLGEDIFTTAYLAEHDSRFRQERYNFDWRPIIDMNNTRLREVLNKGIAENHFHLKGSAPHFDLSWISLMNRIRGRQEEFKKLKESGRLTQGLITGFDEQEQSLHVLVIKAAHIRWLFAKRLFYQDGEIDMSCSEASTKSILFSEDMSEIKLYQSSIQQEINISKYEYGFRYGKEVPDYLIPKNYPIENIKRFVIDKKNKYRYIGNVILAGERRLLYTFYKKFLDGDQWCREKGDIFYAYLIIKARLRSEVVQSNQEVGFKNFADYQNRKSIFLKKESFLSRAILSMAGSGSLNDESIKSFETRIAPEGSQVELRNEIKKIDNSMSHADFIDGLDIYDGIFSTIDDNKTAPKRIVKQNIESILFYTVHFIKMQEKKYISKKAHRVLIEARNSDVRKLVAFQASILRNMRKNNDPMSYRIMGIDAANFEIGCRPEVFSQMYRYLKDANYENSKKHFREGKQKNLGRTFHVGEDFIGLADGLRAIDEAIRFLEFGQGDRIGHALALGIDPNEFYSLKNNEIILSKHDLIDNLAWLIAKARKINLCSKEVENMRKLFSNYYHEIYAMNTKNYQDGILNEVTPELFYDAWKLRGDNPEKYFTKYEKDFYKKEEIATPYNEYSLSKSDKLNCIRNAKKAYMLYQAYHFDSNVRIIGEQETSFKASKGYISLIEEIQNHMMREIAKKNISIECNPSSNYLIGTFKRYDKHPIKRFYNLGLEINSEKIKECPQLSVSINTDDQGIFSTYLENEYALMALAMETIEDEEGKPIYSPSMVYDWLDRIRQMGLEQSFMLRHK